MGQAHGANRMAIAAMANVIKYSKDELLALSKQFQAVARKDKPEDCMSRDLFHSCMELVGIHETDREILDKLFTLYDKTGDDVINYREFVCGISVLMRGSLGDKLEFAFHMFDWDDLGRLSKDEMSRALVSVNSTMSYFGDKHMSEKEIGAIVDGVFQDAVVEDNTVDYVESIGVVTQQPVLVGFMQAGLAPTDGDSLGK